MDFSEQVSERVEGWKQTSFKQHLKNNWAIGLVSIIFMLGLYLRYLPAEGMEYFQALDPYMIFRMSRHLALDGNLPVSDFMRYFPYNTPIYHLNLGDILVPSVIYWLGPFLLFGSFLEFAQFYPALMGALGIFFIYLLGKEIFDRTAGVSAAFFLATIAGVMHRTSAGFFEKEPTGTLFMLVSLYFFSRSWKRDEWISGLASGIALGIFSVSWGGSKMLWLLYPMVVGIMLWLNEDIRNLVKAYTPTIMIGAGLAAAINPSRFWFTDTIFLVNLGMVGLLWSRYLIEEWKVIDQDQLKYYIPSVSVLGLIGLGLSPLYSDFIAKKFMSLIGTATQSSGDVVAGTVAENTPATLGQLVGQLGALNAGRIGSHVVALQPISPFLSGLANINGTWPLAFIGTVFLGSTVLAMLLRKYWSFEETIDGKTYYKLVLVVLLGWTLTFSALFQDSKIIAVGPSVLAVLGGLGVIYGLDEIKDKTIEFNWYYILPLLWATTNILGAVTKSRLVFLAAFSTAFMAGYMFSRVVKKLNSMSKESFEYLAIVGVVLIADLAVIGVISSLGADILIAGAAVVALNGLGLFFLQDRELSEFTEDIDNRYFRYGVLGFVIITAIVANLSAGFVAANSLGGSPNGLWMQNLEYMEQNTPEDAVMLSWWDYGYWFEAIGDRAAVADGGNLAYYASGEKINYPLADFLTSSNPENHTDFLDKHSVDYIILDESMIGKYSAVSQIAHRSNKEFNNMLQLSTSRNIGRSIVSQNNQTLVQFRSHGITVYTPIEQLEGSGSVEISSAPILESSSGSRGEIGCALTEDGVKEFNVSQPISLGGSFGEFCVAQNPYYSINRAIFTANSQNRGSQPARLVLVPKKISDSTIVRLYLMNGHGIDFVEPVPEGSNGFVKMWKVTE